MASKKGSSFLSMPMAKRKFNFSEIEESTPKEIDSIKVYLRVKPYDEKQINESNNVFEVADSNTLSVKASGSSRKFSRGNEEYSYTFTHIFPSDTSQKEVFEKSVKESVVDFINGFSSLIFSYGTTNAGKTFTVQGTTQQPGLIPRALCLVFKSIEDAQTDDVEYMPCGRLVKRMSDRERKNHAELKQTIINHGHTDDLLGSSKSVHKLSQHGESGSDFEITDLILEKETDSIVAVKPASTYSLWISFYEIYNECIYDLLTAPLTSTTQRKQLRIAEDSAKNSFVKELNYVNVTSIQDARKVMIYGRNNLQVAMTGLNAQSSRSHCIFTLTLVCSPVAAETGDDIVISQLSLCDLAGTERQKKTLNVGERLKESQHINCSLHVLSRCFEIIRENQNRADRCVIPYRESKLTKLFQKALRGEEKIIMLVNINLGFSLDDTHQVLKTSAIARKTTTSIKPWQQKKRRSRSVMLRRSIAQHSQMKSTSTRSTLTEVDVEEEIDEEEYGDVTNVHGHSQQIVESLLATIDSQKNKIASYKGRVEELEEINASLEDELRQDLAVEYGKLIKTIEDRLKSRIDDKIKVINEKDRVIADLQRRVNCIVDGQASARKKRKVFDCSLSMIEAADGANNSKVEDDVDVLREENNVLKNDVSSLKSSLAHYKNENAELNKKYAEIKLLRRIENIGTLKQAVDDEDMLSVLDEMDRMKEKLETELTTRNALINEAMEEMEHLEASYKEVISENGKLEGDLLLLRDELDDAKRCLAIANEISAKKSEENQEMEIKLEKLETDNEKLIYYIELAETEIKDLKNKLVSLERNRTQSADIFEESMKLMNEHSKEEIREKYELTNQDILCKELQKDSLEFGTPGEEVESLQQHATFEIDSMNLSKLQPVENTSQSTFTNRTVSDTFSNRLSVTRQPVENTLQSTFTNRTVSDTFLNRLSVSIQQVEQQLQLSVSNVKESNTFENSGSKSLGNNSATKPFNRGNQTCEVHDISDDGLSFSSRTDREEEQLKVNMNQEEEEDEEKEIKQKLTLLTNEIEEIKQNNHSMILLVDQYKKEKTKLENKICELTEEIERLRDGNVAPKLQFHQKVSELSLELNEIKNFHSTTVNLIENFQKEKALFEQQVLEKLSVVKEMQEEEEIKHLKDMIEVNNLERIQRESALESNQELLKNAEKVRFELEEMASALKMSNDELITCNREYADKNEQLVKELESKNEAYESLAQKLSDFEAKHDSLMNEMDTREGRNREYAEENKQLIEDRESLLQKLNDLQINHDRLLNEEYAKKNEQLMEDLQSTNGKCESLLQRLHVVEADRERLMSEASSTHSEYLEQNKQLIKELELRNEANESQLRKLNDLEAINERLTVEMDTIKRDNEEYVAKNHQLEVELRSINEKNENLLQKLNNLEANNERLMTEVDSIKHDNEEYVIKNQQLEDELRSKNEKYESLSQKLGNLETKQECFMKEMDTKESHLREVELKIEAYENQLQKLNDLEANNERLKTEVDSIKRDNEEYVVKTQQLEDDLRSKNEKYESLSQKLGNLETKHDCFMKEMDTKESHLREVELKIEAYENQLQKLNDLEANNERLKTEVDSMKRDNEEYVVKNQQLEDELRSKNEKYESISKKLSNLKTKHDCFMKEMDMKESHLREVELKIEAYEDQLQKLNDLEANNERLMTQVDSMKRVNEEYVAKNQQLEDELRSKNEKYESISQKLSNLEAKHECFIKEMDTKESHLRQVENELTATKKDLELKTDEILKLQALSLTCKTESTVELRPPRSRKTESTTIELCPPRSSSNSKSKTSEHSDGDMDDDDLFFFTPSFHEKKQPPTNTKAERPSRIARAKIGDSSEVKKPTGSSKTTAKRVTRSAASTRARGQSASSSPPHAHILKDMQSDMNCKSPAVVGGRRLLAQPNALPQISIEEFPDDPQVDSESPVSILNRLTGGTPVPHRKLRTRRK